LEAMIEALARALVDHPEQVRVEGADDRGATVIMLHVADEDLGQVIGRGGRIARSLRVLLRASATAHGRRAVLEIVD
jgi:predicted RNA-binding protein YlqC (UPF0109 family)